MAMNIKSEEAHRLAQQIAEVTGESLTQAVLTALRERLASLKSATSASAMLAQVREIQKFVASLPVRDPRPADEMLGYDERGLPS